MQIVDARLNAFEFNRGCKRSRRLTHLFWLLCIGLIFDACGSRIAVATFAGSSPHLNFLLRSPA